MSLSIGSEEVEIVGFRFPEVVEREEASVGRYDELAGLSVHVMRSNCTRVTTLFRTRPPGISSVTRC